MTNNCANEHHLLFSKHDNVSSISALDWTFLNDEILIDRDAEIEILEETFRRCTTATHDDDSSGPEFLLLSGNEGTGKSALARKLRHPATSKDGFFLMAKFDLLQKSQPYSALISAFTEYARLLLARGPIAVAEVKDAVLNALGPDSRLLIDIIPPLEKILGLQEPIVVKGMETHTRLKVALGNFVRAICSVKCPLVLVMDDLQWADSGSLDMLEVLVSGERIQGLVVVGVCRSNEVSIDHHFAAMLRRLEDEETALITHIEVHALSHKAVKTMLCSALHLSEEKCAFFADFLFAQTGGNVFFLLQMLQEICNDGILVHDTERELCTWDESKLSGFKNDKSVVDLLSRRIQRLPDEIKTVLMAAACLGAEFSCYLLSKAMASFDVEKALATAMDMNIILYDARYNTYSFSHDKIQQAAYSLIDENKRTLVHVSIGRQLWKVLSEEELYSNSFLVVNQIMQGASLLHDAEKHDLAILCLEAGKKAVASSDFKTAAIHFWHGIDVCGSKGWKDQYDLRLELHNAIAEVECINANFQKMTKAIETVLSNADDFIDKVQVYSTQVYALFARHHVQEAIDLGLFVLDCLGEGFPSKIEQSTTLAELEKARTLLHGKTDTELLGLPDIDNREKLAAMTLLNLLTVYTLCARPEMFPLIVTRFVMLSVGHGLCAYSAYGFSAYGTVCSRVGDRENGYRYGKLALSILDRYGKSGVEWIPRVHSTFYAFIAPLRQPIRSLQTHLLHAEQTGMKTGDFEFAGFAGLVTGMNAFFLGKPLDEVKEKFDLLSQRFEHYKQSFHQSALSIELQTIYSFMGMSDNPLVWDGELFNEEKELETATNQNKIIFISRYLIRKLMLAYHFDDLELALDIITNAQQYECCGNFLGYKIDSYFYAGLTYLAAARAKKGKLEHFLSEAQKNLDKLISLSDACPNNCMHKVLLLEAEFASLRVNLANIEDVLLPKYRKAIEVASSEGFLHDEALACERAAWALCYYGKVSRAVPFFKGAVDLYKQWNAIAKVNHLIRIWKGMQSM